MIDTNGADRQGGEGGLSWFLWRPWYAKLWCVAAALFWIMVFFIQWLAPAWSHSMHEDYVAALPIALHPFIIVPVLGLRLFWRLVAEDTFAWPRGDRGEDELEHEPLYEDEGIGFHRLIDPASMHPADPLSPTNPASPLYRLHHGDH